MVLEWFKTSVLRYIHTKFRNHHSETQKLEEEKEVEISLQLSRSDGYYNVEGEALR